MNAPSFSKDLFLLLREARLLHRSPQKVIIRLRKCRKVILTNFPPSAELLFTFAKLERKEAVLAHFFEAIVLSTFGIILSILEV